MSIPLKRLSKKTAIITGGNSGIGLATARLFVAEGARVAITGRNQATLDPAAGGLGEGHLAMKADATDVASTDGNLSIPFDDSRRSAWLELMFMR